MPYETIVRSHVQEKGRAMAGHATDTARHGEGARHDADASRAEGAADVPASAGLAACARDALVGLVLCGILALLAECVLFNFDWLATRFANEQPATPLSWAYDPQMQWWIGSVEGGYELSSLRVEPQEGSADLSLYLSDEGHALPNLTGTLSPRSDDPRTQYLVTFSYGKLDALALTCEQQEEPPACVVTPNARVPLMLSLRRVALLAALVLLAWAVRPSSALRRVRYRGHMGALVAVWVACCLLAAAFVYDNAGSQRSYEPDAEGGYQTNRQYYEMAVAFTRGEVFLPDQPSQELLAMDNPYDSKLRYSLGVQSLWDYAYYKGHYYCYFGVLPSVMFHLPYYLATGRELPNDWATCASLFLLAAAAISIVHQAIGRWHPRASWADFVAMLVTLVCCSWVVQVAFWADFIYYLPIGLGMALALSALALWMWATAERLISYPAALAGTLCAALTLACRPQFFLVCVFGLVLLLDKLREPENRSWRVAVIFVPLVVVILVVGWYNHARFGSPFDFGANYNLTSNDMTHRGASLKRMALSLYYYLLQPLVGANQAPFLGMGVASANGIPFAAEEVPGGYVAATPVVLVALLVPLLSHRREALQRWLCGVAVALAVFLAVFDGEGAGVLARYFCDFGWLLGLVAADAWAVLGDRWQEAQGEGELLRRCLSLAALLLSMSCYIQLFWILYVRLR